MRKCALYNLFSVLLAEARQEGEERVEGETLGPQGQGRPSIGQGGDEIAA